MDAYEGPGRLSDIARSPEREAKMGGKLQMQTLKAATRNAKDALNVEVEKLQKEAERLRYNLQRIGGEPDNDQVETISLKEEIRAMKEEKRRMKHLLESMAPAKKGGVSGF
jgi:predicted  nucleic acid-binding Zn-ribbon protein